MLRQHLSLFSFSSSSSPIYTALARLAKRNSSHRVHLASRNTSSSSRSSANNRPLLFLVLFLLILAVTAVFLFPPAIMSSSSSSVPFESPRKVVKKVLSLSQSEGDGATVRRSIGRHELPNLDPFLLLDEFSVSKPAGFPDHPHRGFETVTYMLDGAFTHQDFSGRKGTIRTGDVQWMTAGRGIVHSEMPASDGVHKGLQLWINLASKDKMIKPRYQELESKDISQAEKDGVAVRIIAGEAFWVRSPVYTRTPTMYMDFTMQPGSQFHQPIPEGWNAFVYIIEGEGVFGKEGAAPASEHHCLVLGAGDGLIVWNRSGAPLRFVLAAGQPLNETVVQQGPFVMNSRAQIQKAMEDYYYGRNGFEKASQWSSA
ncbi:pirin-like protein [Hordeum vulgare subsp. vulgare]|uniref:Pirin-like protein n=1 Tax=Hordeum vulgare subsp. vulgare TaxID=112509 RepID=A0A8I6YMR0_HORVV|nr:pirin-like protein [Hordeum vulgare subsp. vulgare]